MAKYLLRIEARKLRAKGVSVRDIAKKLGVSKGTASLWVRDIILTVEQLEKLRQQSLKGGELGRVKSAFIQKQRRLDTIKRYQVEGKTRFPKLSNEELFAAGISLYWAEGSKTSQTHKVQFCNSDPKLMNFMIDWLFVNFEIPINRLALRIGINEIHKPREKIVKEYWSKQTNIPLSQFRKTSFKKTKVSKVYENYNEHFGTLEVAVLKPGVLYYKIMGLIEGLATSQRSSRAERSFHKR